MLGASEATENATTDHYTHLCWQGFRLFHRVGGQYDSTLLVPLTNFCYNWPHKTTGFWVHPSRGLVQKNYRRISNNCNCHWKLALVTARQSASRFISLVSQAELLDNIFDYSLNLIVMDALDTRIEPQVLMHSHQWENCVVLRTVPNQLPRFIEFICNTVASDRNLALCSQNVSGQTLERSGFSSPVDT